MAKAKKDELPEQEGNSEFQRFDQILRKVVSVPKTEIERRESQWRKHKDKTKKLEQGQHADKDK